MRKQSARVVLQNEHVTRLPDDLAWALEAWVKLAALGGISDHNVRADRYVDKNVAWRKACGMAGKLSDIRILLLWWPRRN